MSVFIATCQQHSRPHQNLEKYRHAHCLNTDDHPNPQAFATHSYPGNVRNEPTHTHPYCDYPCHPGGLHTHADTWHSGTHCYSYPQPTAHPAAVTNPTVAITIPTAAITITHLSTADRHTDRSRSHADADNCTHFPSALHPCRPEAIRRGGLESR